MTLRIRIASEAEKPLLHRMMELYQYDFSEFQGTDLDEQGQYGYPYLDTYWTEPNRKAFLARVEGKPAGFALVHPYTYLPENHTAMAEFFVLKKYRQQGIGRQLAAHVFDVIPSKWEVDQLLNNLPAQQFWRKVIHQYTAGDFTETRMTIDNKVRVVQWFDNRQRQPAVEQGRDNQAG